LILYKNGITYCRYGGRPAPGTFLWGTGQWETVEGFNPIFDFAGAKVVNGLQDLKMNGNLRGTSGECNTVMFLFLRFTLTDKNTFTTTAIRAANLSDYETYRNLLIDKE
jgi:hypothetical protein